MRVRKRNETPPTEYDETSLPHDYIVCRVNVGCLLLVIFLHRLCLCITFLFFFFPPLLFMTRGMCVFIIVLLIVLRCFLIMWDQNQVRDVGGNGKCSTDVLECSCCRCCRLYHHCCCYSPPSTRPPHHHHRHHQSWSTHVTVQSRWRVPIVVIDFIQSHTIQVKDSPFIIPCHWWWRCACMCTCVGWGYVSACA